MESLGILSSMRGRVRSPALWHGGNVDVICGLSHFESARLDGSALFHVVGSGHFQRLLWGHRAKHIESEFVFSSALLLISSSLFFPFIDGKTDFRRGRTLDRIRVGCSYHQLGHCWLQAIQGRSPRKRGTLS